MVPRRDDPLGPAAEARGEEVIGELKNGRLAVELTATEALELIEDLAKLLKPQSVQSSAGRALAWDVSGNGTRHAPAVIYFRLARKL